MTQTGREGTKRYPLLLTWAYQNFQSICPCVFLRSSSQSVVLLTKAYQNLKLCDTHVNVVFSVYRILCVICSVPYVWDLRCPTHMLSCFTRKVGHTLTVGLSTVQLELLSDRHMSVLWYRVVRQLNRRWTANHRCTRHHFNLESVGLSWILRVT